MGRKSFTQELKELGKTGEAADAHCCREEHLLRDVLGRSIPLAGK